MPGHLSGILDTVCHLIVPEGFIFGWFLWFSAELFALWRKICCIYVIRRL